MKLKSILLFVSFYVFINSARSQNNVSQRIFSEPYIRLTDAFHVQPPTKYDSGFRMVYELPFTFLFNQISGSIIDMYGPAYLNIVDTNDFITEYATFYPYTTERLVDISDITGSSTFQSKLLRKIETVNGERIFKLEWRNIGFKNCTINDSLNMQLWIFENSNKVQFRFGESNMISQNILNTPDTPIIAFDVTTIDDFYLGAFNGQANNLTYQFMDPSSRVLGIPPNGTVIELVGEDSPTLIHTDKNKTRFKYLIVNNQLILTRIDNKKISEINVEIIDMNGRLILNSNSTHTNIAQLESGIYIVKLYSGLDCQYFKIKL